MYKRDPNRPETITQLTDVEWLRLIRRVMLDVGRDSLEEAVRIALGDERAETLLVHRKDPRLTRRDNHALVGAVYPYLPGESDAEKEAWLLKVAREVWPDTDRYREIVDYVRHRIGEFKDAGGTIYDYPEPDTKVTITGKQRGFVWKPVSDHGKLVVLLPVEFTHKTSRRLLLRAADGHEQWSNRAHNDKVQPNGNREHYRFNRKGGNYRGPVTLAIEAEGVTWQWNIPDPARRYDNLLPSRDGESAEPVPNPPREVFRWNGRDELYVDPAICSNRLWWVTHTRPDGKKYDWRSGQYHRVMSTIRRPGPADGVVKMSRQEAADIAAEGIVQVCAENPGLRASKLAMCWLIRPGKPASSQITEAQWRRGATDGVVLPFGRDG